MSGNAADRGGINIALRQEIVESQKTQADFLKWKLISIATIGAISYGFVPDPKLASSSTKLLVCLIPVLCAYVDLISLHIMIRIITIGAYLKEQGDEYEKYVFEVRERSRANPFVFEAGALHGSSLFFNLIIIVLGLFLPRAGVPWTDAPHDAYIVAGILGIIFTIFLWLLYASRVREVSRLTNAVLGKAVAQGRSRR